MRQRTEAENKDPNARYSNKVLFRHAIVQMILTVLAFGIGSAVAYVLIGGNPKGWVSVLFFVIGCAVGVAVFFPSHFRYARKKRAQFISVGGDPTGITPWMFGAMGGRILKDGTWEWNFPDSYGDGGNSSY